VSGSGEATVRTGEGVLAAWPDDGTKSPDAEAVSGAEAATEDTGIEWRTEHDIRRMGESSTVAQYGLSHLLLAGPGTDAITLCRKDGCPEES
jgi:hypothetical protein